MQDIGDNTISETTGRPSTKGMTRRVVTGGLWTITGQFLPMIVAFVATPFTIRFLGSEGYGVLILIGLIPTYFSFADLGMGIASTKFGSEAFADRNSVKEGEIVRTAVFIALCTSLVFVVPIFLSSSLIVAGFNVPERFQEAASMALKITSVSFAIGILSSVLNTPMLARLRMDLNTLTTSTPKVLLAVITPIVLYWGGGIIGAAWVGLFVGILGIASVVAYSGNLLPQLFGLSIRFDLFRPLLKFGIGIVLSGIASTLLSGFEKLALSQLVSVKALAYYSIAFTFAGMATMVSIAVMQPLVPAFSQLMSIEKRPELETLSGRILKLEIILLIPALTCLLIIARPFFSVWLGEEFASGSSLPFYLLLPGLVFNIVAFIPHGILIASGNTNALAKLYWIELPLSILLTVLLVNYLEIAGAAIAWSIRIAADTILLFWLSKKFIGIPYRILGRLWDYLWVSPSMAIPILMALFVDNFSLWLVPVTTVCLAIYGFCVWRRILTSDEQALLTTVVSRLLRVVS